MIFNRHYERLEGTHAFLSASKYNWINYEDDKLERVFAQSLAAEKGDRLHKLAHDLIKEGIKLPKNGTTMSRYVNDAIGYRMTPEQILMYSLNAYGTADAISFRVERGSTKPKLRIHDLKTGVTVASFHQLEVYEAFFCLEYRQNPFELEVELRIYQNDDVQIFVPDPDTIMHIMEKIRRFDKRITEMRTEAAGL